MTDFAVEGEFLDEVGEPRVHATPWPRLWARLFDMAIYLYPLAFLVGRLFPNFVMSPVFDGGGGSALLGILLMPFALVIDAIIVSAFGNSLGKYLIGTKVATIRNERLDIGTSFNRNLQLYVKGMGFGIPIVAIFTYISNYSKVHEGKETGWDLSTYTRVYNINNNLTRTLFIAVAYLALSIGGLALDFKAQQEALEAPAEPGWDPSRPRADPVAAELKRVAAQLKPQQIDEVTILDRAEAYGRTFIYHYTITRRDASDEQLEQYLNETMVPSVCKQANMRSDMEKFDITYRYHYTLPDKADPLVVDVTKERCRNLVGA